MLRHVRLLGPSHVPERRQVNENRRLLFGSNDRVVAFLCECADRDCFSAVMLTGLQADEAWSTHGWILAPGHAAADDGRALDA